MPHCDFTYEHLYVALSRARKASDIRILLFGKKSIEKDLDYLNDLKPDIHVLAMLAGYGVWHTSSISGESVVPEVQ